DVGEDEPRAGGLGHTQLGVEGRERIVRDFGARGGHGPQQRRLARVGRADQTHVRDQLQVEVDLSLLTLEAGLGVVGRASCRALEMHVAPPTHAPSGHHLPRSGPVEVGEQRAVLVHGQRAWRHLQRDASASAAGLAPAILADTLVLHVAADQGEQRVVATHAYAGARCDLRPALADDDLARVDQLAAEDLDAELLRVRVAAVAGRAAALLVCHYFG